LGRDEYIALEPALEWLSWRLRCKTLEYNSLSKLTPMCIHSFPRFTALNMQCLSPYCIIFNHLSPLKHSLCYFRLNLFYLASEVIGECNLGPEHFNSLLILKLTQSFDSHIVQWRLGLAWHVHSQINLAIVTSYHIHPLKSTTIFIHISNATLMAL
jgi:hypothetical protein